jgi:hypothetical protein
VAPKPDPVTDFSTKAVPVTVPGDFRRPRWARTTAALSDDELFAVNRLAISRGVTGPQMMAILLELTGARRTAYHPDGFYGISNLQQARLQAGLQAGNIVGNLPIHSVADFMNASAHAQLTVTIGYLNLSFFQHGTVPLFLFLATGQLPVTTGPTVPATARLQPWSKDGTSVNLADLAAHLDGRATGLAAEFNARLPVNYSELT